jgi:glycosyltransferase involved in cell wall biosynthesis
VSVVIPAMNEAENLPHVLSKMPKDIYEVVLVDGNSTDGTVEVAQELFPTVRIVGQNRRGKGNALFCGFAACRGDIIVTLDADGSADPMEIPRFVEALRDGADFAKGSRYLEGGGSADITRLRNAGNRALGALVNALYGTRYTDLCYGYNAFWARWLPQLNVDCDGFEVETLLNVRVAKARLQVVEVASFEELRINGESNLHTFRDGFRVLRTILRERFRAGPKVVAESVAASEATT